jgi:DNA-binding IclR family transcriptional regulator
MRSAHVRATPTPTARADGVRAVGRALDILLAFESGDRELSASDLLTRVELSRPTLYRLLYTLEQLGFVASSGEPQRFRLGPSVARLAQAWNAAPDLATVAGPILQALWAATDETVAIFVPQGGLRLCMSEIPSPQALSFQRGVGYTEKIALGASGRAILAHLAPTAAELGAYARDARVDRDRLELELRATRRRGYATSSSELIAGAVAIAVPFFGRDGAVAGSIGVFGPEVRLPRRRQQSFATLLLESGRTLSAALGFHAPAEAATD